MGSVLIIIMILVEVTFLVWGFRGKSRHQKEKEITRAGVFTLVTVLLIVGVLKGMVRYGLFLVILLIQLVVAGIQIYRHKEKSFTPAKSIGIFLGNSILYICCLFPAVMFPQYTEPKVTGNHVVETKEFTWVDESRVETFTDTGEHRAVTVKIWYPADEGKYPLVLFSHGAFGVIDSNTSTFTELASNGYVVASIGHPYHSMFVKDTSGKITTADPKFIQSVYADNGTSDPEGEERVYHRSQEWMELRTADANFVLDQILSGAANAAEQPFSDIDTDKIGMFGHSMGGATAVNMGRQRDDIDAVIDLEGTMFGEYTGFENGTETFCEEPYTVPILDVNSRMIDDQIQKYGAAYVNVYMGEHADDYHYAVVEDAGHLNFTDLPLVSPILAHMIGAGDVDARTCIEHVNELVLNFFNYYLKGQTDAVIGSTY